VIGFNDKTCQTEPLPDSRDVRATYHSDKIQRIVSRYTSHPFVIEVHFPEREGVSYPGNSDPGGG